MGKLYMNSELIPAKDNIVYYGSQFKLKNMILRVESNGSEYIVDYSSDVPIFNP
jgi:hypothetical protein